MEEIWKDIQGYEGLYQISNFGRVKSLPKFRNNGTGGFISKEKILKTEENNRGYVRVQIKNNGKAKRFFVHRLVAFSFIPNPENKPCVNHLDCNPLNNRADNLEWCTFQENTDYMVKLERNKRTYLWNKRRNEKNKKNWKPVVQMDHRGSVIKKYRNITEVKKDGFRPGDVCRCCKGQRKTTGGYVWRYDDGSIQ